MDCNKFKNKIINGFTKVKKDDGFTKVRKNVSYLNIGIIALTIMLFAASGLLVLSKIRAGAAETVDKDDVTSIYNQKVLPETMKNAGTIAAFDEKAKDTVEVDPATGYLTVSKTDVNLPGKNGMDFVLTRIYSSNEATYADPYIINNKVTVNDEYVTLENTVEATVNMYKYEYGTDNYVDAGKYNVLYGCKRQRNKSQQLDKYYKRREKEYRC